MEIKKGRNRVEILIDNKVVAFATYSLIKDDVVNINHTMVQTTFRGQKIASKLMETIVEILIESNMKCIPSCSYAASWFEKHEEYKYLIY